MLSQTKNPIFSLQAPVCCRFFLSPYMEEQLPEERLAFKRSGEKILKTLFIWKRSGNHFTYSGRRLRRIAWWLGSRLEQKDSNNQTVDKRNLSHIFLVFKIYMEAFLKQEPGHVIAVICHMDQKQARPSQMLPSQRCPTKLPLVVQHTQKTNL